MMWRTLPGEFSGYQASEDGRIRNRKTKMVLTQSVLRAQYFRVQIYVNKRKLSTLVSRLVCIAFHGEPPTPKHEAHHVDGDAWNNKPSNLEWVSPKFNRREAFQRNEAINPGYNGYPDNLKPRTPRERSTEDGT